MALKAFQCPHDPDSWATLEDCEACKVRCAPMTLMRAVWEDEMDDDGYHADPMSVSVTQTLGCIRKGYLTAVNDYAEELQRLLARWMGHVVHARLEAAGEPDGIVEETYRIDLGDGFTFAGTVDQINSESVLDWKTTSRVPKKSRPDNIKQLQIYRFLSGVNQPPEVCYISSAEVATYLIDIPLDDSVLQEALVRAQLIKNAIMGNVLPRDLPCEGLDNPFGQKCECDYCPVVPQCKAVEVEA